MRSFPFNCLLVFALFACSRPARPPEHAPQRAAETAKPLPVEVLQFYVSPGAISQGEESLLCYGVANARAVTIQPKVGSVGLSRSRCLAVAPAATTVYTLTAVGDAGQATASCTLKVARTEPPPPPEKLTLTMLVASATEVARGQPVTLCYAVDHAASVRIDPPVRDLEPRSKCFAVTLDKTTTFTVTAVNEQGKEDRKELTITVK